MTVFAFYTDELVISGGPESFHGLPGMILGIGIPRLHTTWFATRVEENAIAIENIIPAIKGKKVDRKAMYLKLQEVMKDWDTFGRKMLLAILI